LGSGKEDPIGAALFEREGKLLGAATTAECSKRSLRAWRNGCFSKSGPAAELSRQNYGDDAGAVLVLQRADPQFGIGTVVVGESVNFRGGIDWLVENESGSSTCF